MRHCWKGCCSGFGKRRRRMSAAHDESGSEVDRYKRRVRGQTCMRSCCVRNDSGKRREALHCTSMVWGTTGVAARTNAEAGWFAALTRVQHGACAGGQRSTKSR